MGHDEYAGFKGRFYRGYIRRPRLARVVEATLWGSDFRPLYTSLRRLATLPPGTYVIDVACGAGLALEWMDPGHGHRYLGIDRSETMLTQAQVVAKARGFHDARFHLGDVASLPVADGAADIGLCFNALHCVADPQAVVAETARCLGPGGVLVGTSLVRGGSSRADRLLGLDPTMGPGGTSEDLSRWLEGASLADIEVEAAGALAVFSAHK